MRAIAIVAVAAAGLVAASAHAQPPWGNERPLGLEAIGPVAPAPVTGMAFGTIPASVFREGCAGFATERPDFVLDLRTPRERLQVHTESSADLVLIIEMPDGTRMCDDDSASILTPDTPNLNPLIEVTQAPPGRYKIWVGVFTQTVANYTLRMATDRQETVIEL